MSTSRNLFYLLIFLSFTCFVNAESSSFIPNGEWGIDDYNSAVELNGNYYVSSNSSKKINIINPNVNGQNSLIGSISPEELLNTWVISLEVYEGHLVVITVNAVFIYEVTNVNEVTLKQSFYASFFSHQSSVNTIVNGKLYIVANSDVFVIEYSDNEFKIFDVIDMFKDFSHELQSVFLNVIDEHIVLFATYYDQDKQILSFLAEVYQRSNHELVNRYTSAFDESFYISAAAAIDRQRVVIAHQGDLKTLNLKNNSFELVANFQAVNYYGANYLIYQSEILWTNTSDGLISYKVDEGNNVSLYSKIDIKRTSGESNSIDFSDMKFHDNKLAVISSHHGLSLAGLTEDKRFETIEYLFNHSGVKGRGVIDGGHYYVTNHTNSTVNKLLIEKNKISFVSSLQLNQTSLNIDKVNGNLLFSGYSSVSLIKQSNDNQFTELSKSSLGTEHITIGQEYLFGNRYINGSDALVRYKFDTEFDLYQFPEFITFPEVDNNFCPEKGVIYQEFLLVEEPCQGGKFHLFDNIYSDNVSWNKLIAITEDTYYYGKAVVVGAYLYFVDENIIRITQFDESLELKTIKEIEAKNEHRVKSVLLAENLLFVSHDSKVFIYNIEEPLTPFLVQHFDATYANRIEMNYDNGVLARTAVYLGIVEFFTINHAPNLSSSALIIDEDKQIILNDYIAEPENDSYDISVISEPLNGVISEEENNTIYTPAINYFGDDKFTVKVEDIHGNFIEQEITVSILPVNDAPIINTTEVLAQEDTELVELLDIFDVEDDQLSYSIEEQAENGTASLNDLGELTYIPNTNYFGNDSIKISAIDEHGASASQTIAIEVESINDNPSLIVENFEGEEDNLIEGQLTATDIEEHQVSFSVVAGSSDNGQVTIEANGLFVFTPEDNFFGKASFIAQVTDIEQGTDQQTIIINVAGSDDAPVAESLTTSVNHNGTISNSLATTDVDGDVLEYSVIDDATNGTISISSVGQYTYIPNSDYSGSDSFTYEVSDGNNSAQGTITFSVMAAPPVVKGKESSGGGSLGYSLMVVLMGLFGFRERKITLS